METNEACPVSGITINENTARLTAFLVLTLAVIYAVTGFIWIFVVLAADFFIRGFTSYNRYSIIGRIVKAFPLKEKSVDAAPKKFAAKLGFIMSLVIVILNFSGLVTASIYTTLLLSVFAALESLAAICVGCYIYSFLQRFKQTASQ